MTKDRYIETVGRRKTASARVRITPANKTDITVFVKKDDKYIEKKIEDYFTTKTLRDTILAVFKVQDAPDLTFKASAVIKGGGLTAQAEAFRHGIARGLIEHNVDLRAYLKEQGYLKRDPRVKERKKPGLRKARRAPQWSKR
jgi:small subunit ribosomal protein S9